ncbi:MAG: PEP-CTERM sorting domain-containing protein [Betaproteobacteria bacterium]
MKTRNLFSLLPLFLALSYGSSALAVPTTSVAVGNSMLHISGTALPNSASPSVAGLDTVGRPASDIAIPPITNWEPEITTAAFTDVKFDEAPLSFTANPTAIPEPSALLLACLGLAALGLGRRSS